jgi:cytochrome c2
MKNDPPETPHTLGGRLDETAPERRAANDPDQDNLTFYVSHPNTAIKKDALPFLAVVNVQQRAELMAYLRTLKNLD